MRVKLLGSAAGGGFPQWNCACSNCRRLRDGTLRGTPRSQSQLAVCTEAASWYLLNASPDLRAQIESDTELHPRGEIRHSPIGGVVLTSTDVDHVMGLLHLREFQRYRIYGTPAAREVLRHNPIFRALLDAPQGIVWTDIIPGAAFQLGSAGGSPSGLRCTCIATRGSFPAHVCDTLRSTLAPEEATLGLVIEAGRGRLVYMEGLPRIEEEWLAVFEDCDLLLVDGTFWTDDELRSIGVTRTARDMGHMPLSGPQGTLARLSGVTHPRKILIHINNTNPILDQDSAEHAAVRNAGWEVAEDNMEFEL